VCAASRFGLDGPHDLRVTPLTARDAERLQQLYDACADFTMLVEGEPPTAHAAADDLAALPPGSRPQDKHVFGAVEASGRVVGMIESIRDYPEPGTWWLGLLMIDPGRRRDGLGSAFYSGFEHWVQDQGYDRIALGVVDVNTGGLNFWRRQGFSVTRTVRDQTFGRLTHDVQVLTKTLTSPSRPSS